MAQGHRRVTVIATGFGFDFHSWKFNIKKIGYGIEVKRGFVFPSLNPRCLKNLVGSRGRKC